MHKVMHAQKRDCFSDLDKIKIVFSGRDSRYIHPCKFWWWLIEGFWMAGVCQIYSLCTGCIVVFKAVADYHEQCVRYSEMRCWNLSTDICTN